MGRSVTTLSGGEGQRIRLAAQLGSNLSGVLYVLDEPTIGFMRDNEQLLAALTRLQERGNSLIVVEHDEETMQMRTIIRPGARRKSEWRPRGRCGHVVRTEAKPSVGDRPMSSAREVSDPRKRRPVNLEMGPCIHVFNADEGKAWQVAPQTNILPRGINLDSASS